MNLYIDDLLKSTAMKIAIELDSVGDAVYIYQLLKGAINTEVLKSGE